MASKSKRFRLSLLRVGALSLCAVVGCGRVESIEHYTVPKPSELAKLTGGDTAPASKSTATKGDAKTSKPGRMLAAIVLQPGKGWFFKLSGAQNAVDSQHDAFDAFLKSVRFNAAGEPTWTAPEGWQRLPGSGMRYASLKIDAKSADSTSTEKAEPLELTVISLDRGEKDDEREYLLSNINRWRGQLQLPPLKADALDEDSTEVELDGGLIATAVDYTGTLSGNTMGGPFAGMGGPMAGGPMAGPLPGAAGPKTPPVEKPSRETASDGFVGGEVPDDWNSQGAGGMSSAAYTIVSGDQKARVTVTRLSERGNELLPNINRWRGQVGMNEIIADELATHATPIDVGSKPAHYIELLPEGRDAKQQAILGVVLYDADQAWFFKMMGDATLVESQRDAFRKFVTSSKVAGSKVDSERDADGRN